jgi:phosphoribosylamine--glycine ligase
MKYVDVFFAGGGARGEQHVWGRRRRQIFIRGRVITPELRQRILHEVIEPTVRGMASEGCRYVGFLYAGLMITPEGLPRVLEYNCRLGDPETQPIMMRLRSDLVELCEATLDGCLDQEKANWDPRPALGVVMTAEGYPGHYRKGDIITGLISATDKTDVKVFHSGTAAENRRIITNGGRVLCVTALGDTVNKAQVLAYDVVRQIHWDGVYYRTDIGYRAIDRE